MKYGKSIAVAVLCGGMTSGLATQAVGQAVPEGQIQGTIQVSEGADYQALAQITDEQARTAALQHVPGATFDESDLEEEDGYLVYEVELDHGAEEVEVLIDAGNGTVLRTESEEDDDEEDDD